MLGNLTFNLGDGNSNLNFGILAGITVAGNLNVNAGHGDLTLTNNTAIISGNASFNLGNGNNTVSFLVGSSVGGKLIYRSGNGNNSLTLQGAQTYLVDVVFGSGDDTMVLNSPALILTGSLDGGGGSNTFTQTNGALAPNLILTNF